MPAGNSTSPDGKWCYGACNQRNSKLNHAYRAVDHALFIKLANIKTTQQWRNGTISAPLLVMFLLAACQSGAERIAVKQSDLQQWVGQAEEVLRASWGNPDGVYAAADGQGHFLTYQHVSATTTHIPADCERDLFGRRFCTPGETITHERVCQQRFEIRFGRVQAAMLEGDGC